MTRGQQQTNEKNVSVKEQNAENKTARIAEVCSDDLPTKKNELIAAVQLPADGHNAAPPAEVTDLSVRHTPEAFDGQCLGNYQLLHKIGSGGMGVVYLAQDLELKRNVALKLLPKQFVKNAERVHRFQQEAQAVSGLNHPNILTVHCIGQTADAHYIVSEFVEGSTMRQQLPELAANVDKVVDAVLQIAQALRAAHTAGVIHRDIKPENVMIRPDGYVKVLDFGLAKLLESGKYDERATTVYQTEPGVIFGTPNYMSPEQIEGKPVDARSDLFALGALLYECLTGKAAFYGTSFTEIIAQIVRANPAPPSIHNPRISPELDAITLKLLHKEPENRFQTTDELILKLRAVDSTPPNVRQTATLPVQPAVDTAPSPTVRFTTSSWLTPTRRKLSVLTVAGLILAALFAYIILQSPGAPAPRAVERFKDGTAALRDGTYYKASKSLEDAVAIDNRFALAHARLAEAWMELDYTGRAQSEMLKARRFERDGTTIFAAFSQTDEQFYIDAIDAALRRDFPEAIKNYQTLVARSPNEPHLRVDLGRAYEKNEQTDKAIECYEKAISLNPDYGAAHLRLGVLQSKTGAYDRASESFDRAERIYDRASDDEAMAEARYQRGFALSLQDNLAKSRAEFERVLAAPRANKYQQIRAKLVISSVCSSEGNTVCARQHALEAINSARAERMDNLAIRGLIDLGNAHFAREEYELAEGHFQQALELAREAGVFRSEARALMVLGSMRVQQQQPVEAERFIREAFSFYEQGGYNREILQAHLLLGHIHRMKGEYNAAIDSYKYVESFGDASNKALAQVGLADAFSEQEKFPMALDRYQQSFENFKASNKFYAVFSLSNFAAAFIRLGDYKRAGSMISQTEEMAGEIESKHPLLLDKILLLKAQMSLSEQRFTQSLKDVEPVLSSANLKNSSEAHRITGLAQTLSQSNKNAGLQNCLKALELARRTNDSSVIYTARLALAEAHQNSGNYKEALDIALEVKEKCAAIGKHESEWRAWLIAAQASRQSDDATNAREYAQKSLQAFSKLRDTWGENYLENYLAKPDTKIYIGQVKELAVM